MIDLIDRLKQLATYWSLDFDADEQHLPTALACQDAADEIKLLRNAFGHTHVAGLPSNIDRCQKCGLDIRNPVHSVVGGLPHE